MDEIQIDDAGIAVMCDIARASGGDLDADKRALLERLIAQGLVIRTGLSAPDPAFEVTRKGQHALDARGVGVNEA